MESCEDLDPAVCEQACAVGASIRRVQHHASCPRSCGFCVPSAPRVYVYPDAGFERGSRILRPAPLRHLNGSRAGAHNFLADQGFMAVLYDNLKPFAVSDPSRADVFFAFITPHIPPYHEYSAQDRAEMAAMGEPRHDYMPNDLILVLRRQCDSIFDLKSAFMRSLTHLTPANAPRHFVVSERTAGQCYNERAYRGRTVPTRTMQLLLQLDVDNLHHRFDKRAMQMPYPSSVRWSRALEAAGPPPWKRDERTPIARPLRVAYTGSLRGHPWSISLRKRLVGQCRRHAGCEALVAENFPIGSRRVADPFHSGGEQPHERAHMLRQSGQMVAALALKARRVAVTAAVTAWL